jgi:hypothetical protein
LLVAEVGDAQEAPLVITTQTLSWLVSVVVWYEFRWAPLITLPFRYQT